MHKPLVDLENVSVVRIPLGGSGIDFSPVVNPGDPVRMGQVIGESSLLSRFSIRSSVSVEIAKRRMQRMESQGFEIPEIAGLQAKNRRIGCSRIPIIRH